MRKTLFLLSFLVGGCAGQSADVPATRLEKVPANAPMLAAAPGDKADAERIAQAKKLGYKIVNQDGEDFFCRTDLKTGSRVNRETVCLTRKQIDDLREQTQQGLANTMRQMPPPVGK